MHRDHFSAHVVFGDLARFVVGVPRTGPADDLSRHEPLPQFPGEKSFPGVSGPERAVAVKRGDERFEAKYTFDEFGLKRCETRHEISGLAGINSMAEAVAAKQHT